MSKFRILAQFLFCRLLYRFLQFIYEKTFVLLIGVFRIVTSGEVLRISIGVLRQILLILRLEIIECLQT